MPRMSENTTFFGGHLRGMTFQSLLSLEIENNSFKNTNKFIYLT